MVDDVRLGELEAGAAGTSEFQQHDDPDVIIPDHISQYLVVSAQLLLMNSIVAFVYGLYVLGALLLFVYFTSVVHWRRPRFSSIWRVLDYIAVAAFVGWATFLSVSLSEAYIYVWSVGGTLVGIIFAVNESAYYLQIGKTPLGDDQESKRDNMLPYAPPNTPEREWVFVRTAVVHIVCIHVLANALTLAIIIGART